MQNCSRNFLPSDLLRHLHTETAGPHHRDALRLLCEATHTASSVLRALGYPSDAWLGAHPHAIAQLSASASGVQGGQSASPTSRPCRRSGTSMSACCRRSPRAPWRRCSTDWISSASRRGVSNAPTRSPGSPGSASTGWQPGACRSPCPAAWHSACSHRWRCGRDRAC